MREAWLAAWTGISVISISLRATDIVNIFANIGGGQHELIPALHVPLNFAKLEGYYRARVETRKCKLSSASKTQESQLIMVLLPRRLLTVVWLIPF